MGSLDEGSLLKLGLLVAGPSFSSSAMEAGTLLLSVPLGEGRNVGRGVTTASGEEEGVFVETILATVVCMTCSVDVVVENTSSLEVVVLLDVLVVSTGAATGADVTGAALTGAELMGAAVMGFALGSLVSGEGDGWRVLQIST